MMFTTLLFIIGIDYVTSQDVCPYDKFASGHTMCVYKKPGCRILRNGITDDYTTIILDVHNQLRNKVAMGLQENQPEAANMKQLTWDPELSLIAQTLTDQCKFQHDGNDERRSFKYEHVGQNVGMIQSIRKIRKPNFKAIIEGWFNKEVVNMEPSYVGAFPPEKLQELGHYTQVVWAETEKVGCGQTYYKTGAWFTVLLICNYGPAGNLRQGQVYEVGPACTKCPNGCSEDYSGLCT